MHGAVVTVEMFVFGKYQNTVLLFIITHGEACGSSLHCQATEIDILSRRVEALSKQKEKTEPKVNI